MMATAANTRARPASARPAPSTTSSSGPRRSAATYVLVGVPLVLALTLAWQVFSGLSHTELGVRQAASVGQVSLEPDPAGARVDLVLVDRVGQEATFSGNLTLKLRDPDGAVWQTTRGVSPGDFHALSEGSLLAGRTGYSLVVPTSDWVRPPRRGGLATITIDVSPSDDGPSFSTQLQQRFP